MKDCLMKGKAVSFNGKPIDGKDKRLSAIAQMSDAYKQINRYL